MPNHVRNVIKMQGITELPLFQTYDDGSKGFDFNKMIPMPESLNMDSGSMVDDYAIYYLTDRCTVPVSRVSAEKKAVITKMIANKMFGNEEWIQRTFYRAMERAFDETEAKRKKMYEDGKTYVENLQNYGYATWYDWCIANWDTKWNAYDNESEGTDCIKFSTAWANPEPVIRKLAEMYPGARIEHWWADEDTGNNTGYRIFEDGKEAEDSAGYYENCSKEAYSCYELCWGEMPKCYHKDENGNWVQHDCKGCTGCGLGTV